MNKPITLGFMQDPKFQLGTFDTMDHAEATWEMYIRGELTLVPSFVKRPDGRLEMMELALVPADNAMPREIRAQIIDEMPVTPELEP